MDAEELRELISTVTEVRDFGPAFDLPLDENLQRFEIFISPFERLTVMIHGDNFEIAMSANDQILKTWSRDPESEIAEVTMVCKNLFEFDVERENLFYRWTAADKFIWRDNHNAHLPLRKRREFSREFDCVILHSLLEDLPENRKVIYYVLEDRRSMAISRRIVEVKKLDDGRIEQKITDKEDQLEEVPF